MNVNPGGKHERWLVERQATQNELCTRCTEKSSFGVEERGVNTQGMNGDQMRDVLSQHPNFKNEKSRVEQFLSEEKHHIVYMLPKFHPELNPIERMWAQAKQYTKAYCKYTWSSLRANVHPALDSVPLESIQKHFGNMIGEKPMIGAPFSEKPSIRLISKPVPTTHNNSINMAQAEVLTCFASLLNASGKCLTVT